MPTYEYACTACGHRLDAVQKFSDEPLTVCPECGGALRKVYGAVGIVLKGSGFYKNDSRSGSSSAPSTKKDSDSKESTSGDTKSDSSTKSESSTSSSSDSSSSSSKDSKSKDSKPAAAPAAT